MIRLGHIDYSNCLPMHALLLEQPRVDLGIVHGTPAELNRALAEGSIDVAPCSSIEYALRPGRYRLLPGLVIGSNGPVRSIRLESTRPLDRLSNCTVAVPTASATSVLLLRILLELRFIQRATFQWFDQEAGMDPIDQGASAALWIGDTALRRAARTGRAVHDLGQLWTEWSNLPMPFALWQTRLDSSRDAELQQLTRLIEQSRARSLADPAALAARHADRYGISPQQLAHYWSGLHYTLDHKMQRGLLHYYELAAELGEIERVPMLDFVHVGGLT
jgi:chorismate dehydratase